MRLFVEFIGPSTNSIYSGCHWSKRKKAKDDAYRATLTALREAGLEGGYEPFSSPVHITTIPRLGKGVRTRDCSNFSYAHKMIEDALVSAGLIVDDTPEWVRGMTILAPIVDRQAPTGIEVIIQEVAS